MQQTKLAKIFWPSSPPQKASNYWICKQKHNNRVNADPQTLPLFRRPFNSFLPRMLSANWLAGRLRGGYGSKMEKIQIAYSLRIEGLLFNEITFSDVSPEFKNIILKPVDSHGDNTYELLISKYIYSTAAAQLKAIFDESTLEAEKFVYVFSASADVKIFEFKCLGYYQKEKLIKFNQIFSDGIEFSISLTATAIAGEPRVTKIKNKMKEEYDLASLQMYYDSATIIEPIGRFISLYTLLLHKFSDRQKQVDDAILSVDPTISQFKSPLNTKIYETIFTKLRNELSHKRDGVNILKTHNEVKSNIERFERIVKELMLNKP